MISMSVSQLIAQLTPHSCHFSSLSKARIGHRAEQTLNGEVTLTFLWRFSPQSGPSLISLNITLLQHKLSRVRNVSVMRPPSQILDYAERTGVSTTGSVQDQNCFRRTVRRRWWCCIRTSRRPPAICLRFMYIISDIYIKHPAS